MPVDLDESQFLAQSIALPLVGFDSERRGTDNHDDYPVEGVQGFSVASGTLNIDVLMNCAWLA